jgi:predicted dehydrogenase
MQEKNEVWLIGAGLMALDYAKVLNELKVDFTIITRGEEKANDLKKIINCNVVSGGIEKYLKNRNSLPKWAINAVGIDKLNEVTQSLLNAGVKNILLEKPGVAYANEIYELSKLAQTKEANVLLAYNRRFHQATIAAKKIIEEDGGVASFNFEFTEWSHSIEAIKDSKTQAELQNWFLGNSTHVIDLAFYLGGNPAEISCYFNGQDKLGWHSTSSNYSGAGITKNNALFTYHANWTAPGRFSVEILTNKHRLIFRPLEKLQIQKIGSVAINMVEGINYELDEKFKPGLYLQTQQFLNGNYVDFCSLSEQERKMELYKKMSGYK